MNFKYPIRVLFKIIIFIYYFLFLNSCGVKGPPTYPSDKNIEPWNSQFTDNPPIIKTRNKLDIEFEKAWNVELKLEEKVAKLNNTPQEHKHSICSDIKEFHPSSKKIFLHLELALVNFLKFEKDRIRYKQRKGRDIAQETKNQEILFENYIQQIDLLKKKMANLEIAKSSICQKIN